MLSTTLTRKYGLELPMAQAGMAFAGMTPDLAIAVGRAGALGSFAVGLMPPQLLVANIKHILQANAGPLNINFITIYATDAHIDVLCEQQVAVASFHWGHPPRPWITKLKAAGIDVWEQVGSPDMAARALDDGIDVLVVQGSEAGGHNYAALPTFVAVPTIVDIAKAVPVLAAGGIADGRGLAAALALGAAGAWLGTRLVMTDEAAAHPDYKRRLVAAGSTDTTLTSMFGRHHPHFNPMRVLRNRCVVEHEAHSATTLVHNPNEPVIGHMDLLGQRVPLQRFSNLVPMPSAEGDFEEMALLSGQGVGLVKAIEPAGTVLRRIGEDAERILRGLSPFAVAT